MNFHSPQFLWLLILIPIYWTWFWLQKKHRKKQTIWVSVFKDLKKVKRFSFWQLLPIINPILITLILILFTVSLARPQTQHQKQKTEKLGIDIIVALDVSQSMLAEDIKPNRIEGAKNHIKQFISRLENDRLGIIVFSGAAFTQSPLTFDTNILAEYLDQISTETINQRVSGLNGTAIGDAVLAGLNRFKESEDRSKVMILLTDGDANRGADPQLAAQAAAQENIKIYTIGIGKHGGAPLPTIDAWGNKTYARNRDGSMFMATFNEQALKSIASITKGQYFRVTDSTSFDKVLNQINKLEKRPIETQSFTEHHDNFKIYLISLYIILMVYICLNTIRVLL